MIRSVLRVIYYIGVLSFVIILYSCTGYQQISSFKNVASIYNPSMSEIHPEFMVYHVSDSISNLYFNIDPEELRFNSANPEKRELAQLKVHYNIYGSSAESNYFDSTSVIFNVNPGATDEGIKSLVRISLPAGNKYFMEVTITDLLTQSSNLSYIFIDKSDLSSSQNYLITDQENEPVINRFLCGNKPVKVENSRANTEKFYVGFITHDSSFPFPPFSLSKYKEHIVDIDTSWVWNLDENEFLVPDKEGIYFISNDSGFTSGITVYNLGEFFPHTKTPASVLYPIRYLQSSREYKKLLEIDNKKLAVDSFWLAASGNLSRSKELIRIYYSRVYFANKYFSSFKEGWRTDRGMIFIVFGPPKTIYISGSSERWIYGDSNNLMNMDFYFDRKDHLFCKNNFVLSRQEVFKSSWYQAVDSWRNGRAYSILK